MADRQLESDGSQEDADASEAEQPSDASDDLSGQEAPSGKTLEDTLEEAGETEGSERAVSLAGSRGPAAHMVYISAGSGTKYRPQSVDAVLKDHPEFSQKLGWSYDPETRTFSNPRFGSVKHVIICDELGKPLWDQYIINEKPGTVILPWDIDEQGTVRVGLILQERPVPGKKLYEAPRGFIEGGEDAINIALRELYEETGIKASPDMVAVLGLNNPNASFYQTSFPILAVRVPRLEEIKNPGQNRVLERIEKVKPFTYSEIVDLASHGHMECGITNSALLLFGTYRRDFR